MTLTSDESLLYALPREDLQRHARAVQQYADEASRAWTTFTVAVLMLPPQSSVETVMAAARAAGLADRCREIWRQMLRADELVRATRETLRRRGLA
jgi:hypothetical protein